MMLLDTENTEITENHRVFEGIRQLFEKAKSSIIHSPQMPLQSLLFFFTCAKKNQKSRPENDYIPFSGEEAGFSFCITLN